MRTHAFAVAAVVAAGCAQEMPEPPALPVTVHLVEGGAESGSLRYSASLRPDVQVDVAFKVGGYIEGIMQVPGADGRQRAVQDGDQVRRGAVLARVREGEYRDALTQAEAALTQSKANFDRISQLYENRSASKADYDAAYASFTASQARRDQAALSLSDCTLRAPMDGYVLRRAVEIGALVSPGSPGFTIADTRSMKVVFGVPDVLVGAMRMGAPQEVTTEAVPGVIFRGRITRVAPSADPTSRVFEVEVTIPNADGRLRAGMIAGLQIARDVAGAPVPHVPLNAVVRPPGDATGFAVFVVEEGDGHPVARLRRVELGGVDGNLIRVVAGLQGGERVIVRGASLAVDAQPVRVVP